MRVPLVFVAAAVALAVACPGCSRHLPEEGTPVAGLYLARCGTGCHRPYQPGTMTSAMWEVQLARMAPVIAKAGLPPLTAREKADLLAYLQRNAEGHAR